MITLPNGKICMNEQEAIQWLLDNYPVPFQCSANYIGGAEIGLGTIVNPTPAKVKVGSIIFFADSKVSTVVAVNADSFVCSEQYNDLVDDVVYVSNVQLNASGHLIVTLSNGDTIDSGLVKQVSGFSINGSQHLIVTYNDGTSADLGPIFTGNVNIAGNLTANSIIENMSGYVFYPQTVPANLTATKKYVGAVKNGNKLTLVFAYELERSDIVAGDQWAFGRVGIPEAVGNKLYPAGIPAQPTMLDCKIINAWKSYTSSKQLSAYIDKESNTSLVVAFLSVNDLDLNTPYYVRMEVTFLLSDSL